MDVALDYYKGIISDELYYDLLEKVKPHVGKTVIHFSATAIGGGVAELLQGLVRVFCVLMIPLWLYF